jgi:hypothetical protein
VTELAIRYTAARRAMAQALADASRLTREYASQVLRDVADTHPEMLTSCIDELVDALARPEALTRYNVLAILHLVAKVDMRLVDRAWDGVEECLYDERSAEVRLGAFRLLAAYGASTQTRSVRTWPLLKDALRCYHGDPEFITMINELVDMLNASIAGNTLDDEVRKEVHRHFKFDAESGHGVLKRKASAIRALTSLSKKKKPKAGAKAAPKKDASKKGTSKTVSEKDASKKSASKKGKK